MRVSKQRQLTVFSLIAGVLSLTCIVYVIVERPDYLTKSREGTPFFTPPVINPDTGEAIDLDELIRHYKAGG